MSIHDVIEDWRFCEQYYAVYESILYQGHV